MNQYTTKIWKENPNHVSMIQFEFLNGSSIFSGPDKNEWFGDDSHNEPMRLSRVYAIVSRHGLLKEVEAMSLAPSSEVRSTTSEEVSTRDEEDR